MQEDPPDRELTTQAVEPSAPIGEVRIATYSIWQTVGIVVLMLLLFWALKEARTLVSMLVISLFFSLALQPPVNRLHVNRGWRRGSAVGVVYLIGGVFVIVLILILVPAIAAIASAIGENAGEWAANLNSFLNDTFGSGVTVDSAEQVGTDLAASMKDWAGGAFGTVLGIASSGIGLIFNMATIAMFTFYFTAEAPKVQRAVLRLFHPNVQPRIGWAWDEAIKQTGGYFYSRAILMVINGLGFFFTMVLVGLPVSLAAGLAIFAGFVSEFIPAVGTYIGGAVPILVILGLQGLTQALIMLGYVLVYQQIENYYLSPKISANTMSLNGGVAFGAALAGGALAGPMGAFMALPVAALITSIMSNYGRSNPVVYVSPYADPADSADAEAPEDDQ